MFPLPMPEIQSLKTLDSSLKYSRIRIRNLACELIIRIQKICNDDVFHAQVFSTPFNLLQLKTNATFSRKCSTRYIFFKLLLGTDNDLLVSEMK